MRVLVPEARSVAAAPPWRRMRRLAIGGMAVALLVAAGGWMLQRGALGADQADARRRVEARVRAEFETMARRLSDMAETLSDPAATRAAVSGDTAAARALFVAAAREVTAQRDLDVALTVYALDGDPVAWAGRPSEELPLDRLQGAEAWFVSPGALGLRLVYVRPVGTNGSRVGTIAAERSLVSSPRDGVPPAPGLSARDGTFTYPTRLAAVSIELPYEDARTHVDPNAFEVAGPSGERLLTAVVAPADLDATRARWRRATVSLSLVALALTLGLLVGPLLDWRRREHRRLAVQAGAVLVSAGLVVAARLVLRGASLADWAEAPVFSGAAYASALWPPLLASPFDFLLTAVAGGALVALGLLAADVGRLRARGGRRTVSGAGRVAGFAATQIAAGVAAAAVLVGHEAMLQDTINHATLDLLHYSLHPMNSAHLALQTGLVIAHATAFALVVLILWLGLIPWCVPRGNRGVRLLALVCWIAPLGVWGVREAASGAEQLPLLAALAAAAALTLFAPRLKARYRHGSQAFRLMLLTLGLIVPAFAFYPTAFQLARQAKAELVETRYAPQALEQRPTVQMRLRESLTQIDRFPQLAEVIAAEGVAAPGMATDRAFQVWQTTALAEHLITSSIELYGPDDTLVSRFALNLPEELSAGGSEERQCDWELYEEVSPFFADDRLLLHAGRAVCTPGGEVRGSIIVHATLDYENLSFIASRRPYFELLRPADPMRGEGLTGRDVEYAVYGWSRTPVYASGPTAWPLPDEVFASVEQSRAPIWTVLDRGAQVYDVLLLNDRGGIYALGFPVLSALDHMVNLAELTVLAAGTYLLLLAGAALFGWLSRRHTTAPALLREVRASFYRKLFLAFVAAVFLPVVALALLTRYYVAEDMRATVEEEAVRTATTARRVIEDLVAPRAAEQGVRVDDDNLMVWVSRLIGQDVNTFAGARLVATSERNLFASGLLPTRTPAEIYHALELRNEATTVSRERIGRLEYLVAATPLMVRQFDRATLTVPLTTRQQEIERQIEALDRRVLLGALLFILAGAGLGYRMAERIADPVNRLTRATRRIARGDLDARIAATSSDELRRLVEDFNSMASELQRQRRELERTHRLEAWAEMARQVAHEIKNPLTPIQLNAEHLRRVHADRGEPLGPVLQECVATILAQVRLLRQIASEFSSFASSPSVTPTSVNLADLLHEVVDPYRTGLEGRIHVDLQMEPALPRVRVDRTIVARAITNLVENALHAMPGEGRLEVTAGVTGQVVQIRVTDTGVGMAPEARARAFEPYFSTKATGTGLGLPIAKRNVELSGGTISVTSARDRGTTVELTLPVETAEFK